MTRQRPANTKKVLIAELKAIHPDAGTRKICELIDNRIDAAPISQPVLAPLESWLMKAHGARSWVDVYNHTKTKRLVRSYVNKVPPLKTTE